MPVVEPNISAKVLVTGANGYIAMWLIHDLLEQGYSVRGVVRTQAKADVISDYFKSHGDKLEMILVQDITKEGAFDEAVKNVDAIEHTASPLPEASEDPNELIQPAVFGTLGVLKSAMKFGNKVKRIVLTSSCAAIVGIAEKPTVTFDETNWGDTFVSIVEQKGREAPKMAKYRASKTLAEKAAWKFYNENKQQLNWDLVAINPPVIIGPALQDFKQPKELGSSLGSFYEMVIGELPDDVLKMTYSFVHVRDVVAAHITSLRKEAAGGERMIISEIAITCQELRNRLSALRPDLYEKGILPRGNPNLENIILYEYNADKGKRILGLKYLDIDQMLLDTIADFEKRGWLEKSLK